MVYLSETSARTNPVYTIKLFKKKASRTAVLNRLHVSPAQNLAIQICITPFPSEVSFVFVCIYEWVSWGYIS